MKSYVLHTVWCHISGEAAGEIWHWSLSGVKGLIQSSNSTPRLPARVSVMADRSLEQGRLLILSSWSCPQRMAGKSLPRFSFILRSHLEQHELSKTVMTCVASKKLHPHGNVLAPGPWVNPHVTSDDWRRQAPRCYRSLVAVSRENLLMEDWEFLRHITISRQ